MKYIACTLILMGATLLFLHAGDQLGLPANLWRQTSKEISTAVLLGDPVGGEKDRKRLEVLVKNTSSSTLFFSQRGPDSGVEIYYINSNGKPVPIHAYDHPVNGFISANVPSLALAPGQILTRSVTLKHAEIAFIAKYPVVCRIYISNQEIGNYGPIETAPAYLLAK